MSDRETLLGATNRAKNVFQKVGGQGDYFFGVEGGIEERKTDGSDAPQLEAFAWIVVLSKLKSSTTQTNTTTIGETTLKIGKARTATFFLPEKVAELIRGGMELGHADDVVFGRTNSKQETGAVGLLTREVIRRAEYYAHAAVLALIPDLNPELF